MEKPIEVVGRPKLKVFSLNTGLSGRQEFTEVGPRLSASWRFDRILDFIYKTSPDVVTLQEVYEEDLERLGNALGGRMFFSRYCYLSMTDRGEDAISFGVVIGSRRRLMDVRDDYYDKSPIDPNMVILNNGFEHAHSLLSGVVEFGSQKLRVATTHFLWNRSPIPNPEQLGIFNDSLAPKLRENPTGVLTSDFNTSRGYAIYDSVTDIYGTDNIPEEADSTFDISIRPESASWPKPTVVDGYWTGRDCRVTKLRMVTGLSDHMGIEGEVEKVL